MSHCIRTVVALTMTATAVGAQQRTPDTTRVQRLPAVITTASRYAAPPDSLPRRVEVISRAQLDNTPSLDLADLLKKRAGLDVVQYPGALGGIGIRGFRPQVGSLQQRVLLLLDGRPSGITNVGMLDLQDVERIEVLKGPASALYGSSAMGGVVNVVTRKRTGGRSGVLSASGGSFGASELRVQGGGSLGAGIDADVSLRRYDQRNDFRIGSANLLRGVLGRDSALKMYPGTTTPSRYVADTIGNGLTRSYTTLATSSGTARIGGTVAGRVRLDVRGEMFDAQDLASPGDLYAAGSFFPGDGRKDLRRVGGSVEAAGTIAGQTLLVRAFSTRENSGYYDRPDSARFVNFESQAYTDGVQVQDVLQVRGQQLVAGVDLTRQRGTSKRFESRGIEAGTFSPNSEIRSAAVFGEARLTALAGRLVTTLGARLDRVTLALLATPFRTDVVPGDDAFDVFNPSAGVLYTASNGLRAHGSVGRAFLAPDAFGRAGLTQSVNAGLAAIAFGNPGLRPEQSVTADVGVGISRAGGAFDADVTWFTTSIENRISTAQTSFAAGQRPVLASGTPVSRVQTSVNAGDGRIRGLEATVRYDIGAARRKSWSLAAFANGTRLFTATETTPSVTVDAAQFAGVTNFSPASIFQGVRIGTGGTTVRIKNVASTTVNAGLEFDSRTRWRAGLTGRYVGTRTDSDFTDFSDISDIEYPPFAVLDLTLGARLTRRLRADLQVSNVTDENYYEKRGYNLPGRALLLRLTSAF